MTNTNADIARRGHEAFLPAQEYRATRRAGQS